MSTTVNEVVQPPDSVQVHKASEAPVGRAGDAVLITDQIRDVLQKGLHQDIPLKLLRLARPETNKGNKGFFNARTKKGLEPESIAQMKGWITDHGLISPVAVRPIEEKGKVSYEIVAGERRTRAIQELVKDNNSVYCQVTDTFRPASEVYETVRCFVMRDASDERAIEISYMENDSHVPIPEGDVIFLCEWLLENGYTRDRICKLLKKSPGWLSQTFNFRTKLDDNTFGELCEGKLSRSFCIHLTDFPEDARPVLKEKAIEVAVERHEEQQEVAAADVVEAQINLEMAQEKVTQASNPVKAKRAERKVERAAKNVKQAEAKVVAVAAAPIVPQQSDIDQIAFEEGLNPTGSKGLSTKQIHDHWVTTIEDMLATGDRIRDPKTNRVYPVRDLKLALSIAEGIAKGSRDILGVIATAYHNQGYWGTGGADKFMAYREQLSASKKRLGGSPPSDIADEIGAEIGIDEIED
jgi:hypothetical protein